MDGKAKPVPAKIGQEKRSEETDIDNERRRTRRRPAFWRRPAASGPLYVERWAYQRMTGCTIGKEASKWDACLRVLDLCFEEVAVNDARCSQ